MALKEILAPHIGRRVKMGRRRPVARCPRMHLQNYLRAAVLPTPPASCDYSAAGAPALQNIYLNDQYGDCVIAGGYHVVGLETGNANGGHPFVATTQQIVADYSAIGGFDPNNPQATDNGCDEQTALNYWTQHGFADGTKLIGWLAVDATNMQQVMTAMFLFENLFFGIELPDAWINPMPSASGFVWDVGTPDPDNGHCVMGVGYTPQGVKIDTWGMFGTLTWAAIAALCTQSGGGELYVMLTPDQLAKGQAKAPNGINWTSLLTDFNTMGGNVPVPAPAPAPPAPAPTPPHPAPPAPTGAPTLVQAIAWATQGLQKNWPAGH